MMSVVFLTVNQTTIRSAVSQTTRTFCDKIWLLFTLSFKKETNKQYHIVTTRTESDQENWNLNLFKTDYQSLSLSIKRRFHICDPVLTHLKVAKNVSKCLAGGRFSFCWRDRLWWVTWLIIHQSQKLSQKKSLQHDNQHYIWHFEIISNFPSFSNANISNPKSKLKTEQWY